MGEKQMPARLAALKAYVGMLAMDMGAAKKFSAAGEDAIEATIRALLSGSNAMAAAFYEDLKTIVGDAAPLVEGAIAGYFANKTEQAIHEGARRASTFVADLLNGKAREKRKVGEAFMEGAKNLGKPRGGRP